MNEAPSALTLMMLGVAVGLLPFVLMLCTSFLKVAVVLALLRNAIGVQQVPPPMALNGLAIIITLFIMFPVASDTMDILRTRDIPERVTVAGVMETASTAGGPLKEFMLRNTNQAVSNVMEHTARRVWPERFHEAVSADNPVILMLSFAISEISRAFELGFLLYLPFICIDLVVSNILLSMGMMMVSPMTISLPFKLLLFTSLNGWMKVFQGLILSYR
ncbi:MAG: type III secretion system export apparatus subunit SctR [Planctomycetes bacterium]|nr:type III secretion system export apparatus subunit SctR [Planctomycetota bacterium]